jgi:hypothetical protein
MPQFIPRFIWLSAADIFNFFRCFSPKPVFIYFLCGRSKYSIKPVRGTVHKSQLGKSLCNSDSKGVTALGCLAEFIKSRGSSLEERHNQTRINVAQDRSNRPGVAGKFYTP